MPLQFQHLGLEEIGQDSGLQDPTLQDSGLQDLDLQDIQFLMETVVPAQAQLALDVEDDDDSQDDPTVVVESSIDAEKAFLLINKVLPLEACLHHHILPLYVEGSQIFLGMVDLQDTEALEYARMILGYQKYQLVTQTISAKVHHQVLQRYLYYQRQVESQNILPPPSIKEPTPQGPTPQASPNDLTAELPVAEAFPDDALVKLVEPTVDDGLDLAAPETLQLPTQDVLTQWPIALHGQSAQRQPQSRSRVQFIPGSALPELRLQPARGNLRSLPPQAFLHNLLLKVLQSGVGRLFLARQDGVGRVLWTESGAVKAGLEGIDLAQLQGVIDELKALTHLPIVAVQNPVEVEIERLYQKQRVLLRLRITPKSTGEEATLQILRGAALKFYQQQQLKTLSRDTLTIADELRRKIMEFQRRTQTAVEEQNIEIIPELDRVINDLEQRLLEIRQIRSTLEG